MVVVGFLGVQGMCGSVAHPTSPTVIASMHCALCWAAVPSCAAVAAAAPPPLLPCSEYTGSGDVKYHLGTSYNRPTVNGKMVHLSLMANPSHLEVRGSGAPVLGGSCACGYPAPLPEPSEALLLSAAPKHVADTQDTVLCSPYCPLLPPPQAAKAIVLGKTQPHLVLLPTPLPYTLLTHITLDLLPPSPPPETLPPPPKTGCQHAGAGQDACQAVLL
jgi:hypothetical protein